MNRTDLIELVRRGENSGVEFQRGGIAREVLARDMAALLNLEGGYILLGVEDDRTVSGLPGNLQDTEAWVMQVARDHVEPALIPYWETLEW